METMFKVRSESESLKSSRQRDNEVERTLPRGEYLQSVIGPKLIKSQIQPKPIHHLSLVDQDDSIDLSPSRIHLLLCLNYLSPSITQ